MRARDVRLHEVRRLADLVSPSGEETSMPAECESETRTESTRRELLKKQHACIGLRGCIGTKHGGFFPLRLDCSLRHRCASLLAASGKKIQALSEAFKTDTIHLDLFLLYLPDMSTFGQYFKITT